MVKSKCSLDWYGIDKKQKKTAILQKKTFQFEFLLLEFKKNWDFFQARSPLAAYPRVTLACFNFSLN